MHCECRLLGKVAQSERLLYLFSYLPRRSCVTHRRRRRRAVEASQLWPPFEGEEGRRSYPITVQRYVTARGVYTARTEQPPRQGRWGGRAFRRLLFSIRLVKNERPPPERRGAGRYRSCRGCQFPQASRGSRFVAGVPQILTCACGPPTWV